MTDFHQFINLNLRRNKMTFLWLNHSDDEGEPDEDDDDGDDDEEDDDDDDASDHCNEDDEEDGDILKENGIPRKEDSPEKPQSSVKFIVLNVFLLLPSLSRLNDSITSLLCTNQNKK